MRFYFLPKFGYVLHISFVGFYPTHARAPLFVGCGIAVKLGEWRSSPSNIKVTVKKIAYNLQKPRINKLATTRLFQPLFLLWINFNPRDKALAWILSVARIRIASNQGDTGSIFRPFLIFWANYRHAWCFPAVFLILWANYRHAWCFPAVFLRLLFQRTKSRYQQIILHCLEN